MKPTKEMKAEKKIKALNKKLAQIDALIQKKDAGEELDEQQLDKIDTLEATMAELDEFLSGKRR